MQILGNHEAASRQMKGIVDLEKQQPSAASQTTEQALSTDRLSDEAKGVEENSVLPMQPGDLDICSSLLRCGAFYFSQASLQQLHSPYSDSVDIVTLALGRLQPCLATSLIHALFGDTMHWTHITN